MRVAVLLRAGGAAASAQTVQAERAAEAMRRNGWRGEARRAIRSGAWPERRREGLKPAGPGQPAGPVRSTKARRRSRHAKVSPCDTAMESQFGQDGCRKNQLLQDGGEKSVPATRRRGKGGLPCKRVRTDDAMLSGAGIVSPANTANRTSGQLIERRLPRVRSGEAEQRGAEYAMRPGPRAVSCGSPAQAQPVGRRPQAGQLFGEPAAWRPAAVWSSSGRRRHGAASGARPAGLGGPGGAGGGDQPTQAQRWRAGCAASRMTARSGSAGAESRALPESFGYHLRHLAFAARIVAVWRLVWRIASLGREGVLASSRQQQRHCMRRGQASRDQIVSA